jgi:predicted ester cyclase
MVEQNKELVRRLYDEVFNRNRTTVFDELVAEDFIDFSAEPGENSGRETLLERFDWLRSIFPGLRISIEDVLVDGDKVAVRWRTFMSHTGEPYFDVQPSGKPVTLEGMAIYRIVNNRIAELWHVEDRLSLHMQMTDHQ